jgi:hypothetical protein
MEWPARTELKRKLDAESVICLLCDQMSLPEPSLPRYRRHFTSDAKDDFFLLM